MIAVPRQSIAVALCAGALAVAGCGSASPDERYAEGWDAVCTEVKGALQDFRTDLVTAARTAPDAGDDAARAPLPAAAAAAVLERPAQRFQRALRAPLKHAQALDPPEQWRAWHRKAVARFSTQAEVVSSGVRRVSAGDAEALPSLAIGGFGPADVDAPQELRDHTPVCVALR